MYHFNTLQPQWGTPNTAAPFLSDPGTVRILLFFKSLPFMNHKPLNHPSQLGLNTGTAVPVNTGIDLKRYGIPVWPCCTGIPLQGTLLCN